MTESGDVLIRGMEMPKGCAFCRIRKRNGKKMVCQLCDEEWDIHDPMSADHRLENCPLVPVPPHGRLIDANVLKKIVGDAKHMDAGVFDGNTMYSDHLCIGADYDDVCAAIDETPTVIPAEEGE